MFGLDTVEEWLLVTAELVVLAAIAIIGAGLAVVAMAVYLIKSLWYWDLSYLIER